MNAKQRDRSRILAKCRRIKGEIAQLIQDCESWNENNRWGDYMEPDPGGILARQDADMDRIILSLAKDAP